MNIKIKALFFALLLIVSVGLKAQETSKKYEYISVTQYSNFSIHISRAGQPVDETTLPKTVKSLYDYSSLLEQVEKLEAEGWIVYSTQSVTGTATSLNFILRREKK